MAFSFIRSPVIFRMLLSGTVASSSRYCTRPSIYGSYSYISSSLKRLNPWSMAVIVPSGSSRVRMILATVPYSARSSTFGSSTLKSFCGTVPINRLSFSAT